MINQKDSMKGFRRVLTPLLFLCFLVTACAQGFFTSTESPTTSTQTTSPTLTPTSTFVILLLYFSDTNAIVSGVQPFQVPVTRSIPVEQFNPESAIDLYFHGPTYEEQSLGLTVITSGFTGLRSYQLQDGIARVVLDGNCFTNGSIFTIASPLYLTLRQFPEVQYVKLYDQNSITEQPDGRADSIPPCLEP
jgi:hypothetical protein